MYNQWIDATNGEVFLPDGITSLVVGTSELH